MSHCLQTTSGKITVILLKFAKDKVFDQLTKLEKGKFSHRVSEINKRHVKATKMARDLTKRDDTTWIVSSETDPEANYVVNLVNETCDCKLRCSMCAVCIHLFSCTCMDSIIHATVCKHVHLVKLITEKKVKQQAEHIYHIGKSGILLKFISGST